MLSLTSQFLPNWIRLKRKLNCKYSRIFRYIQWMCRSCLVVYVCFETIAKKCNCSIRCVTRALNYFYSLGWLGRKKTPFISNEYFMPDELKKIDLDDPKLCKDQSFTSKSVHTCVHVLGATQNNHEYVQDVPVKNDQKKEKPLMKKTLKEHFEELPFYLRLTILKDYDFEAPGAKKFIQSIPEVVVVEAMNDYRWYKKIGKIISNPVGLFINRIKAHMAT